MGNNQSHIISEVCDALTGNNHESASKIARDVYPFIPIQITNRRYTEHQSVSLFIRDGFLDRYSGEPLIFPATLRLLSKLLPDEFPFHPNWKMSETHIAYWELFPTVDHIVPIARGGIDLEENWVTTSMIRNSAKSNWTLEELDWELLAPGEIRPWSGLMSWFLEYVDHHPALLADKYLRRWQRAAISLVTEH